MHEVVKNEKKESSRARPPLQTRTGPTALLSTNSSMSLSKEEEQQKRIAARAAAAMAQVLHRRREPRSLLMWGDRRKAVIKHYPDGGQEIIVPQTLTPEQEHYEFPPRSRFLIELATSTAERRRLSVLQQQQEDHVVPCTPADLSSATTPVSLSVVVPQQQHHISPPPPAPAPAPSTPHYNTTTNTTSFDQQQEMRQPDQLALQEWFSKKEVLTTQRLERNSKTTVNKDRAVIDWMNDVERSSKNLLSIKKQSMIKPSPTPSCNSSNKIQFKSDAGKRWANSITSNTSLVPPDDTSRKHYVPRRLLLLSTTATTRIKLVTKVDSNDESHVVVATQAASKIQKIWKDYQSNNSNNRLVENQIGMAAMATTGQRTPIAGMVHLVQMLHDSLKVQQQRSHDRMKQLELLLKEETRKRHLAEKSVNTVGHEKERAYQTLLSRVSELEQTVKREGQSRKELEDQLLQATNSNKSLRKQQSNTTTPSSSSTRKSSVFDPSSRNSSLARSSISSSRKVLQQQQQSSLISRKQSVIASANNTRSLARTSSLANAGVISSSSLKRISTTTKPIAPSATRRTTTVPSQK